ncbi:RnfH family protein [Enterobacter sp. EA-1]|nr:RnfH family protein [Enterobacter sp. EA-1]
MSGKIAVEVAYALPEKQYLQRVTLDDGATVEQAILASGLLDLRDDIDLNVNKVGIYSRPAKLQDVVRDGDRVEIYRPLIADPKELRRQRAEKIRQCEKVILFNSPLCWFLTMR